MSGEMDQQRKLAPKVIYAVDRANRKVCVRLLQHNVEKPESWCVQVRKTTKNKEDEKFQQIVYVKYKIEEFFYLLDLMNSV